MRRVIFGTVVVAAIAASYGLGRHQAHAQKAKKVRRHIAYYVDPMHPAYKSATPGIAPDCGMALEPVFTEDPEPTAQPAAAVRLSPGSVKVDTAIRQVLGIRVAAVEKSGSTRIIRTVGRVAPEDTRVYKINAGVDGFIRETYADSVGTEVKKNQTLAAYYAPEFIAAASGFLAANERIPGSVTNEGTRSIQNYTDRLRNLGMSDTQIDAIAKSKQLPRSIDVVAPVDGFILARNISPGQHFDHDMELYRVADLSRVWVIAEIYEQEARAFRPGSPARIALRATGRELPARVTDSLPQSEAGGGTVKVRLEVANAAFLLRPEMLVDVDVSVAVPPAITVPVDALVSSGQHAHVYVQRDDTTFEPREVETGWRSGDRVEVVRGLKPGERVIAAATFLIDSESRRTQPEAGLADPPVRPEMGAPDIANHNTRAARVLRAGFIQASGARRRLVTEK